MFKKTFEKTGNFSMFLFKNIFRIILIGSTVYIVYKYNSKLDLSKIELKNIFKKKPKPRTEILDIINDIVSENSSGKIIERLPDNKIKKILKNIVPDIEIEIKPTFFKNIFKKQKKVTEVNLDTKLIDSILRELEKMNK